MSGANAVRIGWNGKLKQTAFVLGAVWFAGAGIAQAATLAKVNDREITGKDVELALSNLPDSQRATLLKDKGIRRQVVMNLIDQEILADQGEKKKFDQDADYKNALAMFRKQYLANRLLEKEVNSKVTTKAAKAFYESNLSRFSTEQVNAQHILVSTAQEAEDVLKKVKAGSDFQKLAESVSKDPSAKNNRGDLGYFTRDAMVPEFSDAAFAAKDGEIVGPVQTAYGFHVIKVIGRKPGKAMGFDEIELKVKAQLRQDLTRKFVAGLRQGAKVTIDEKAIEKM